MAPGGSARAPGFAVCNSSLVQLSAKVTGNIMGAVGNSALPICVKAWADFGTMVDGRAPKSLAPTAKYACEAIVTSLDGRIPAAMGKAVRL